MVQGIEPPKYRLAADSDLYKWLSDDIAEVYKQKNRYYDIVMTIKHDFRSLRYLRVSLK